MNPILALIIANIIWGAAPPIFKFALQNIPPFTLAFIRFYFAGLLILLFVKNLKVDLRKVEWLELLLGAIFGISVNITFFFWGLQRGESINSAVIISSGPVFFYFLSIIFLREKPQLKVLSGRLVALLGVLLIIFAPVIFNGQTFSPGELQGNLFFVIATLGAVLHSLLQKNVIEKIGPLKVSLISFFVGAVTFLPFMLGELKSWSFNELSLNGWTGIIFGVFFSSALAYYLYSYGLGKIKAQEVGIFVYVDPIVAVAIAAPLLHEYPDLYFFLGSILVFGGIYIAEGRLHWHPIDKLKVKN